MTPALFYYLIGNFGSGFRPFTDNDWDCYGGCESDDPHILEIDDYVIILDGDAAQVTMPDGSVWSANMSFTEI